MRKLGGSLRRPSRRHATWGRGRSNSWADALAKSGLRSDQITLRMTRAEIGNYLGMTLETVSRALSRLARDEVIEFAEKGRRDIRIPDIDALSAFVQRCLAPTTLQ